MSKGGQEVSTTGKQTKSVKMQTFAVPQDAAAAGGLFVGGGWHQFKQGADGQPVLAMPMDGDYTLALGPLGYTATGSADFPVSGASDVKPA